MLAKRFLEMIFMNKDNLEGLISEFTKAIKEIKDGKKIDSEKERAEADRKIFAKYLKYDRFDEEEYMYLICTILNSFCSTRMGADRVYATTMKFIKSAELIKNVLSQKGPLSNDSLNKIHEALCQKIQLTEPGSREFTPYSFATKFLAFHSEYSSVGGEGISLFPIYDSQVGTIITKYGLKKKQTLEKFINKWTFTKNQEVFDLLDYFKNVRTIDLRNYPQFYKLMRILSLSTGLNFTQLDRFLWKLGDKVQKT